MCIYNIVFTIKLKLVNCFSVCLQWNEWFVCSIGFQSVSKHTLSDLGGKGERKGLWVISLLFFKKKKDLIINHFIT